MAVIADIAVQGAQMLLVLLLAPVLTGFVRKVKARLLRRQGPPLLQPYRDLVRLMRKEVVLADSASWLFLPVGRFIGFAADRLNHLQFLTIRQFLSLVFAALVLLLLVLAIWQ